MPVRVDDVSEASRRWRQFDAELRVNAVRIAAIAVFYGIHLLNYLSASSLPWLRAVFPGDTPKPDRIMHLAVTMVATTWILGALLVHSLLRERVFPRRLAAATTILDTTLLTAVLLLTTGAASSLVAVYLLIVIASGLRFDWSLVWVATSGAVIGYLVVLGATRWPRGLLLDHPLPLVPRHQQLIMLATMLLAGVLVAQWVRHSRPTIVGLVGALREDASE